MKNNSKFIIFILFCYFALFQNKIFANDITFDTLELNIIDNGKIIKAGSGSVFFKKNDIKINAKSFEYNKISYTLNATDGVALLSKKNIQIKADRFIYDEKNSILRALGNVFIEDLNNNITFKTEYIFYKKNLIESNVKSTFKDKSGNNFITDNFVYTLNDNLIKISNAQIIDIEDNIYYIEKAYLNLVKNSLIGKDISINFNNNSFNEGNEPRLKGRIINTNKEKTIIEKGIFTTCKKNDDCPPWQLSSKRITHDKNKKTINYKDALLKIYDVPVLYFPKFFHPDPTVKRQSGFLMPSFTSSNSAGSAFALPYFHVISDNKDFTLRPRFYSKNETLIQSEYRSIDTKSNHMVDFSLLNQGNFASKQHFFSKTVQKMDFNNFDESELNVQLQLSSHDTYLKKFKLESPLINDYSTLTSKLELSAASEDLKVETQFIIYESLSEKKNSDKYEYILPNYNISKNFNNNLITAGNFNLNSNGYLKNYNTNIYEKIMINDFVFNSFPKFTKQGLKTNYNFLIKNVNTDSENSEKYKEDLDTKIAALMEYNSSFPLQKKTEYYTNIFKPVFSARYSPNNSKNMRNEDRRINVNNIFSLNRIGSNDSLEGGASLSFGTEFYKTDLTGSKIFDAKIANVFRLKEDKDLPTNSSLGKKTSDIVGGISYKPNTLINIDYEFSQNENLKDTNYQLLKNEFRVNNFVTTFEYLNENNTIKSETYVSNKTVYNFDKTQKLIFEARENKKTKATEFYNLMYEYRSDCLAASVQYNKDYYSDRDLKPIESIFLKLTIIPFGETKSPDLKQ
ncbi:hypothetical protein OAC14_02040 [Candidatus Pelagibacter sp.]|nr:hypothetical protein [Candidatus Pelagibacter sp.]